MTRSADRVGRALYFRGKGMPWIETVRPWITPVMLAGAGGKYMGLQTKWAVMLALAIPVVTETVAVLLGWWEHRMGATAAHYRIAAETDVYKTEHLALLRQIEALLRALISPPGLGRGGAQAFGPAPSPPSATRSDLPRSQSR